MSSTNKTTYYELPQFISTDIPTWLGDFNGAMSAIDTAMKSNADRADLASTSAGQAVNTANAAADAVGSLETAVTGLTTRVGNCEDVNTAQSTQISTLNTSVSGLDDRVTALEGGSAGGHTYRVFKMALGTYSGSSFSSSATLTGGAYGTASVLDDDKMIGIDVAIEFGNGYGHAFVPTNDFTDALRNLSILCVPRAYANSGCTAHHINLTIGSLNSSGSRSVTYVSDVATTYTCGSGTSGSATLGGYYNTDGIYGNPSVTVTVTGLYLKED